MRTRSSTPPGRAPNRSASLAVMALAALVLAGAVGSSFAQGTEALRIDVTLDEYSFSPDPLRIPAGREVTLVIRNAGRVGHEFMAGRDPESNDFTQDLFAGLHVNIEEVDMAEAGHAEHTEHAGHDAQADHDAHHDADAGQDVHAEDHEATDADHAHEADASHTGHGEQHAEEQAHGEGHEHGTMVEAQAGQTFVMTFTLPEDRRGEWTTGCFLPGHYEAGMHGTLIVE